MTRSPAIGRVACLALALAATAASSVLARPLRLHVSSPDWRDQIIYFALTDRFDDGDPRNNDLRAGEFDPRSPDKYNGGDLTGLTRRVDYIKGLGATALWITPPVANQWLSPDGAHAGYHGYWAENFVKVDRHLGTLDDYRRLSHTLHEAGMFLVQDIVVNHMGDYFGYRGGWDPRDPTAHYQRHERTPPTPAPTQSPFDRNDPRKAAHRRAAIYHWTPDVTDFRDAQQLMTHQMSSLDDLNTDNPVVRRALRDSHAYWVHEVGVDAMRVDTAFYVPPDFFADFLNARDWRSPDLLAAARRTGRQQFHVFGEGFGIDRPFDDTQARRIEGYMTDPSGRSLLPGMLNFPLYGALGDAFARGRPTAELAHRITRTMQLHARPHLMPTFVDNHDVDRFLAAGSEAGLRQALLALMTLPGIPVLYYGTEQGFTQPRAAMFKAGWGSGGRDRFDTTAPLYRYIAGVTALRRSELLFSRGRPTVLAANPARPGALAWRMDHAGRQALVVFNTADHEVLLDHLDAGGPHTAWRGAYGITAQPADLRADAQGRLTLRLAPRSGQVWLADPSPAAPAAASAPAPAPAAGSTISLNELPAASAGGDFDVRGSAPGVRELRVVVDGDLAGAQTVQPDRDGRFQARIDTSRMTDARIEHRVTAWADGHAAAEARRFRVDRPWTLLADQADPAGDDQGPTGRYRYPTDPSWGANRQLDLRRVRVFGAGGAMKLELDMHRVTRSWNPANGFDHVAFTVFIELPGRPGGATRMPLQNATLPAGMRWHVRLRAHGWSNALHGSDGAGDTHEGTPLTPAAGIEVQGDTVRFILAASALGHPASLSGARVYVTTWDYDGGYRALQPEPGGHRFGGGRAGDPLVMDASPVIVLP